MRTHGRYPSQPSHAGRWLSQLRFRNSKDLLPAARSEWLNSMLPGWDLPLALRPPRGQGEAKKPRTPRHTKLPSVVPSAVPGTPQSEAPSTLDNTELQCLQSTLPEQSKEPKAGPVSGGAPSVWEPCCSMHGVPTNTWAEPQTLCVLHLRGLLGSRAESQECAGATEQAATASVIKTVVACNTVWLG